MLTQNEKQILGYMVDMGALRGQERINAGTDDEIARQLILAFKQQMQGILPMQISQLEAQKNELSIQIQQLQNVLDLWANE